MKDAFVVVACTVKIDYKTKICINRFMIPKSLIIDLNPKHFSIPSYTNKRQFRNYPVDKAEILNLNTRKYSDRETVFAKTTTR